MSAHKTRHRLPAIVFAWFLSGTASAQLEARLFVDKIQYAVGEPVFLNFELKNSGDSAVGILTGDSYGCGGYRIELISEPSSENTSCPAFSSMNCIIGARTIESGAALHDRLLLNYEYVLAAPGVYEFRARRILPYGPPGEPPRPGGSAVSVDDRIVIQVEQADATRLQGIYKPYLASLGSQDEEILREAARVIGSLAPPFLEDAIFDMLESPTTRPFALLGLRRLNTARSRQALAELVDSTQEYSFEREQAIRYLSKMQDKTALDDSRVEAGRSTCAAIPDRSSPDD